MLIVSLFFSEKAQLAAAANLRWVSVLATSDVRSRLIVVCDILGETVTTTD